MADVFTKRKRSEVMSRIRGRGNKDTEGALAKLLRSQGVTGWRRQQVIKVLDEKRRAQRSRPTKVGIDFLFPKQRVAVFVDGCFWHGCPKHSHPAKWLRKSAMPAGRCSRQGAKTQRTGKTFWQQKMAANIARDRLVTQQLREQGWKVVRIWEHDLQGRMRDEGRRMKVVEKIRKALAENS